MKLPEHWGTEKKGRKRESASKVGWCRACKHGVGSNWRRAQKEAEKVRALQHPTPSFSTERWGGVRNKVGKKRWTLTRGVESEKTAPNAQHNPRTAVATHMWSQFFKSYTGKINTNFRILITSARDKGE